MSKGEVTAIVVGTTTSTGAIALIAKYALKKAKVNAIKRGLA